MWDDWKAGFGTPFGGDVLDNPLWVYQAFHACEIGAAKAEAFRNRSQPVNGGRNGS